MDADAAIAGCITDPRNDAVMRVLSYIDIGERAGSGLPKIFQGWQESGYGRPHIGQSFDPERTTLVLPLGRQEPLDLDIKPSESTVQILKTDSRSSDSDNSHESGPYASVDARRQEILRYVLEQGMATRAEVSDLLGLGRSRTSELLNALVRDGLVCSDAVSNERLYRYLKHRAPQLQAMGTGATFKELSKRAVSNLEIVLPSMDGQLAAVHELSGVERVMTIVDQQLAKLDELVESRFVEMFEGDSYP